VRDGLVGVVEYVSRPQLEWFEVRREALVLRALKRVQDAVRGGRRCFCARGHRVAFLLAVVVVTDSTRQEAKAIRLDLMSDVGSRKNGVRYAKTVLHSVRNAQCGARPRASH
jgi:hypothetical protein